MRIRRRTNHAGSRTRGRSQVAYVGKRLVSWRLVHGDPGADPTNSPITRPATTDGFMSMSSAARRRCRAARRSPMWLADPVAGARASHRRSTASSIARAASITAPNRVHSTGPRAGRQSRIRLKLTVKEASRKSRAACGVTNEGHDGTREAPRRPVLMPRRSGWSTIEGCKRSLTSLRGRAAVSKD